MILELGKRYDQEAYIIHGGLHNPSDVYNTYKDKMAGFPDTTYNVIAINTKNMVTVTKLFPFLPSVRQIMRWAVSNSAAALFVCRNTLGSELFHKTDKEFVAKIYNASTVIGIHLLDYLVIGKDKYMSTRERGLL